MSQCLLFKTTFVLHTNFCEYEKSICYALKSLFFFTPYATNGLHDSLRWFFFFLGGGVLPVVCNFHVPLQEKNQGTYDLVTSQASLWTTRPILQLK